MTLRTPSRVWQGVVWVVAALIAVAAYVVIMSVVFGGVSGGLLSPYSQRVLLPILAILLLVGWETRWDGLVHERRHRRKVQVQSRRKVQVSSSSISTPTPPPSSASSSEAEALYRAARRIPHQHISNYGSDQAYMEMLGKAAAAGSGPALERLGHYALRRHEWVEAYYWLYRAQRQGIRGLELDMRKVRQRWVKEGYPGQGTNVNALFTQECGRVGRALLCAVTGHDAASARAFLKEWEESLKSQSEKGV